jgi:hypothetical protein
MGERMSSVPNEQTEEGCDMSEQEIEDRISWVYQIAAWLVLVPIAVFILVAYGIAWLMTPDCECK